MKDVLLFKLTYCPHCRLALRFQEELLADMENDNPLSDSYHITIKDLEQKAAKKPAKKKAAKKDEAEEAALANTYDYYYVPTYYVGGKKVHEGHAEKSDVERVLRLAAES